MSNAGLAVPKRQAWAPARVQELLQARAAARASVARRRAREQGFGGVEEDRTPDLRIANATLSQLSYHPSERGGFYPNGRTAGIIRGSVTEDSHADFSPIRL